MMRNTISVLLIWMSLLLTGCVSTDNKDRNPKAAAEKYVEIGLSYLQSGNRDQARFNLKKAVELDPKSAQVHHAKALLYQADGEAPLAEKHFKRAVSLDRSFTQARSNYARYLLLEGRAEDSEAEYEKVIEDVNYRLRAQAFLGLGLARKRQNDYAGATEAFKRAYQRDQRTTRALLELADLAMIEEDYVAAKGHLDQYEKLARATPRSLKLGLELAQIYDDSDSTASYSMSLRNLFPDSKEAREHILSLNGNQ